MLYTQETYAGNLHSHHTYTPRLNSKTCTIAVACSYDAGEVRDGSECRVCDGGHAPNEQTTVCGTFLSHHEGLKFRI